jgi:hypothetical protein
MNPGEIFRHDAFYFDSEKNVWRRKYVAFLASLPSGDVVARLLTSRSHGRPEKPPCFHGDPYPSYFLGIPGGELHTNTWLDLRYFGDVDAVAADRLVRRGVMTLVKTLDSSSLTPLLECAAAADDTTHRQEQAIRDQLARMR